MKDREAKIRNLLLKDEVNGIQGSSILVGGIKLIDELLRC